MSMPELEMLAIKERVEDDLFKIPGVNGVGLAYKRVGGEFTDELAIIVYVSRKLPRRDVPDAECIPDSIEGIPTDVVESPTMVIQAGLVDDKEYAELRAGIQIDGGGTGTLGFIGRTTIGYQRGAGRFVLVSNQHVLRGFTQTVEPGSSHSIGQATEHGCCESCDFCSRIVGHLRVACVLNEDVDGGVAELKAGVKWLPEVQDSPNPIPITDVYTVTTADLPYPVWKRGRTTFRTTGIITDRNKTVRAVTPDGRFHRIAKRSIRIEGPAGVSFSEGGDSGAPIMDNSNRIVGILFGGGTNVTMACHIQQVQSQLHVEVGTTANTPLGVQEVPVFGPVLNDRNMYGPPLPMMAVEGEAITIGGMWKPSSLYEKVIETDAGRRFVRQLAIHQEEIRRLARITRVIAAWRRNGGASVTASISRGLDQSAIVVPEEFRGRSADHCAYTIAKELSRYAGPELAAEIARYVPMVKRFAGKSVDEILAVMSQVVCDDSPAMGAVHA